jgi:uncharacterized membrane protein YczE
MSLTSRFMEFLRPHKTIPITPWRAAGRWDLSVSRVAILFFGLFIFGIGESLLIQSNLGNAPWSVLAQGLAKTFDSEIGLLTFIISAIVLLLWIPLKEKPGFGTIANIVIIAAAIQLGIDFIPPTENTIVGLIYVFAGIALVGAGSSLYITCGLGPGPRDGLMTALHHKTFDPRRSAGRHARRGNRPICPINRAIDRNFLRDRGSSYLKYFSVSPRFAHKFPTLAERSFGSESQTPPLTKSERHLS